MVDPHVHLRDWEDSRKDTLVHSLLNAYKCGFNQVFEMPNTKPPLTSRQVILDRLCDAQKAVLEIKKNISYHLYAGLTKDEKQIKEVINAYFELFPLVIGLKLFAGHSTGGMGIIDEEDQKRVFRILAENNYTGVLAIHCEKESLMNNSLFDSNDFSTQSIARPAIAEIESLKDMISFAKAASFKGTLHVAHISCKESLEIINRERENNLSFSLTCGATAHHALLNQTAADNKSYAKMNPPLRSEEDRLAIFNGLLDGTINWIESDHAPHTIEDKIKGAGGVPGFSGSLLLINALIEKGASKDLITSLVGKNVYKQFNLDDSGVSFAVGKINELKQKSYEASLDYPYDAFISLR